MSRTQPNIKMEPFVKLVNVWKSLTTFIKRAILDNWHGSEYASGDHVNKLQISKWQYLENGKWGKAKIFRGFCNEQRQ